MISSWFFYLPPKFTDKEKVSIATYFGYSFQYQSIENNKKRILTHILKRWYRNKSSAHPSAHAITPDDVVALKVYDIELK